jgi:hypothetical protein
MGRAFQLSEANMADDAIGQRGRNLEDDYFHRKEKELIEKIRKRREEEAKRQDLAASTGTANAEILQTLHELGYNRDTVLLLHLVPLISIAWADDKVSGAERDLIIEAAKMRGIAEDSAAYAQLNDWLTNRPSEAFLDQTLRVIANLAETNTPEENEMRRNNLLDLATRVASASGGILGLGKISDEEQALIDRIANRLRK